MTNIRVCTEGSHTPGPWRLSEHEHGCVVQRGDEGGFFVQGLSKDQVRADARLIAAAPDLLAALERIVRLNEQMPADHPSRLSHGEVKQAIAAITKARGE